MERDSKLTKPQQSRAKLWENKKLGFIHAHNSSILWPKIALGTRVSPCMHFYKYFIACEEQNVPPKAAHVSLNKAPYAKAPTPVSEDKVCSHRGHDNLSS